MDTGGLGGTRVRKSGKLRQSGMEQGAPKSSPGWGRAGSAALPGLCHTWQAAAGRCRLQRAIWLQSPCHQDGQRCQRAVLEQAGAALETNLYVGVMPVGCGAPPVPPSSPASQNRKGEDEKPFPKALGHPGSSNPLHQDRAAQLSINPPPPAPSARCFTPQRQSCLHQRCPSLPHLDAGGGSAKHWGLWEKVLSIHSRWAATHLGRKHLANAECLLLLLKRGSTQTWQGGTHCPGCRMGSTTSQQLRLPAACGNARVLGRTVVPRETDLRGSGLLAPNPHPICSLLHSPPAPHQLL